MNVDKMDDENGCKWMKMDENENGWMIDWLTSIYSNFGHTKEMQSPEGLYDYAIYNGELVHFLIWYKLVAQKSQYVFIEKVDG